MNVSTEYQLASVIIFHYYDKNSDEKLSATELEGVEDRAELPCRVTDLVLLYDQDNDSSLSLSEFKLAIGMQLLLFLCPECVGLSSYMHGSAMWLRAGWC